MGISGISTGFPVLSRSSGQVAHVLLTRSPLGLHRCCHRLDPVRLACIKHAASVRPEPGSNSSSRPTTALEARSEERSKEACHCFVTLTYDPGTWSQSRPHWLLALALPFSRSDRALA